MIVDASLVVDAVCDPGPRGIAARGALGGQPPGEALIAPGHFAFEVLSALRAAANRPDHPFSAADLPQALQDAESYEIRIEGTPWADVHRAWVLSERSLRFADAVYVAAAERHQTALLSADSRIERSGAGPRCQIITVQPAKAAPPRAAAAGGEGDQGPGDPGASSCDHPDRGRVAANPADGTERDATQAACDR